MVSLVSDTKLLIGSPITVSQAISLCLAHEWIALRSNVHFGPVGYIWEWGSEGMRHRHSENRN